MLLPSLMSPALLPLQMVDFGVGDGADGTEGSEVTEVARRAKLVLVVEDNVSRGILTSFLAN